MTTYTHSEDLNDVLFVDGEGLALTETQLLRIGPIAVTVIEACEQPRTLQDLVAVCVDIFGPAPDGAAEALVTEALASLVAAGVLDTSPA